MPKSQPCGKKVELNGGTITNKGFQESLYGIPNQNRNCYKWKHFLTDLESGPIGAESPPATHQIDKTTQNLKTKN